MQGTKTLPEIEREVTEPDGMAHHVRIKALLNGGPVVALCGKKYIPTVIGAEVMDRKVCPTCADLYAMLGSMYG